MRNLIGNAYLKSMVQYLHKTMNMPLDEAEELCKRVVDTRFSDRTVTAQVTVEYGKVETRSDISLYQTMAKNRSNILVPSGSIYLSEDKLKSVIGQTLSDLKALRKKYKKAQMMCEESGDTRGRARMYRLQTSKKIIMNSLPGSFGSPYNLFYDKGGYNAITSLARSLIMTSYTITEQFLGGNAALFNEDDVVTHIITTTADDKIADKSFIREAIDSLGLYVPTKKDLLDYYYRTVHKYQPPSYKMYAVEAIINNLPDEHVTYLFYYCNFDHLFRYNPVQGKNFISRIIYITESPTNQNVDPNFIFKMDDASVAMILPLIHERLGEYKFYELPKKNPELAKWAVSIYDNIQKIFAEWNKVLETFIFRSSGIPMLASKKRMLRNTVIVSDTDSIMFTAKRWIEWYTGEFKINRDSYGVTIFVIYWLSRMVAHELAKYCQFHGISKDKAKIVRMKNEFLYPIFLLFDLKKMYAGIVAIQEGLILKKPKPDIKGGQLNGSDYAVETVKFSSEILQEDVLNGLMKDRLSGEGLLTKAVKFENHIRDTINKGSTTFLKRTSVRSKDNYDKPESTAYLYLMAWNEIFGQQYGEITAPIKCADLHLLSPTDQYFSWLQENYPETHKRWCLFYETHLKHPSHILINPALTAWPPELTPLADTRSIILHNMKPTYKIFEKIGLGVGYDKQQVLLSDLYTV